MAKHKVEGHFKVYVSTWFEDDGKRDLNDQAFEAINDAALVSEAHASDDIYTDDTEIESLEEFKP